MEDSSNNSRDLSKTSSNMNSSTTENALVVYSPTTTSASCADKAPDSTTSSSLTCGICLEEVKERGEMNSCSHSFCYKCIEEWAKVTNLCPVCKKEFTKLVKRDAKGKISKAKKIKKTQTKS